MHSEENMIMCLRVEPGAQKTKHSIVLEMHMGFRINYNLVILGPVILTRLEMFCLGLGLGFFSPK